MIAVRLIFPELISSLRTGATLVDVRTFELYTSSCMGYTHSSGFAGSIMTASLEVSSTTRYA